MSKSLSSLFLLLAAPLAAAEYNLYSPEELVHVFVKHEHGRLSYSLNYGRRPMVLDSTLALEGWDPGRFLGSEQRTSLSVWRPLYGERSAIPDNFRELTLRFERLTVFFRAYEEGAAFRYRLEGHGPFELAGELTEFRFPKGAMAWQEHGTEGEYFRVPAARIKDDCERPLTVDPGNGLWLSLAEAGQTNYPRMLLGARDEAVVTQLDGNVTGKLPFATPWRVLVLGRRPGDLLERNYLILNLSPPQALTSTAWIKPGKVLREVTLSTRGGKAAVDFAAANGLQYIEYDAGWYGHEYDHEADARTVSPDPKRIANIPDHGGLDLPDVINYAKQKNVGVILYVNRRQLEARMDELFPLFRKWGVAGVKFGFVNVKGQQWSQWLTGAIKKAAAHQLMVDVHDSYRPSGLTRTYPNLMTVEGVRGNEHMPTATHNATLPFTRAIAGSMDYTICWMTERLKTTWGHQLAQLVVHYSPWNFVFWYDRPDQITPSPGLEFFAAVPTVWDETRVLAGAIGTHAVVARRKGREWFIGAITNEEPRTVELRLGMLDLSTRYELKTWCDGERPRDIQAGIQEVKEGETIQLRLAPSGGCAARISPK
ncbi:MAG: glycoside hydrolase family 97 catalytic domain-containing protein [Bryobacteraceae bacterium]|nr:glycoside hydrolase family 97 catalytic domain-containing protein [Bryobacteraceae bacterium]